MDQQSNENNNNSNVSILEIASGDIQFVKPSIDDTSVTSLDSDNISSDVIGSARTPWFGTSILIVSKVMGVGVLSLPLAAVQLGWVLTLTLLPLFAIACIFTAYQLQSVKLVYPEVKSYADAGKKLVGSNFGTFARYAMIVTWMAESIDKLITVSDGIESIYSGGILSCNVTRTAIAAIIVLIPSQTRDFHSVAKYLSLPSTLAIIVVVIAIVVALVEKVNDGTAEFAEATTIGEQSGTNIFSFFSALGKLTFAYQGQSIFMEVISEAKNPKDFTKKSSSSAFILMWVFYTLAVVIGYGVEGDQVVAYLPDVLTASVLKTICNVLIVFHCAVGYVVDMQAVHTFVHSRMFTNTYRKEGTIARLHWLLITASFVAFAFIIGNIVPFFGDINSLIGSLMGAPIVFGFPSLYYLLSNKTKELNWKETLRKVGPIKAAVSCFFLFVLCPLFCIFGTIGAVTSLIHNIEHSALPFHC